MHQGSGVQEYNVIAEIILTDMAATTSFARRFGPFLKTGDVVALDGALGAGKTALCRALIQGLGCQEDVPSPTFNLVQIYVPPGDDGMGPLIWHLDLYRLESPEDVFELGIEEAFDTAVTLIEWPSKMAPYLPAGYLTLRLDIATDGVTRKMSLIGGPEWQRRLKDIMG